MRTSASIPAIVDADDQVAPDGAAREDGGGIRERVVVPVTPDLLRLARAVALQQFRVVDLDAVAERIDAHGIGPIDPAIVDWRLQLCRHHRVELLLDGVHVGFEELNARVLSLEVPNVETHVLHCALGKGGAHRFQHIVDAERRFAGARLGADVAEATRGAQCGEGAGDRGVDGDVAAVRGAHRHIGVPECVASA